MSELTHSEAEAFDGGARSADVAVWEELRKRRGERPLARENLRDHLTNFAVGMPRPFSDLLWGPFRRASLWWLFHAYGKGLVKAPAGPPDCRFQMWLDSEAYSDFVFGSYERLFTKALRDSIQPGFFCVDVGANLGYFSILMSRLTGKNGSVVSFEPMPDTYQVLAENVEMNHLENVEPVAAAAGAATGSIELLSEASQRFAKTASAVGYRLEGPSRSTTVSVVRLDEFLAKHDRIPDFIKVDVEGAELAVLQGAWNTLRSGKTILLVEIHGWESERNNGVLELLSKLEYNAEILEVRRPEALCLARPRR